MKRYKRKLKETGEWSDYDDDLKAWKDALESDMKKLEKLTKRAVRLKDIRGFDAYQGPYAIIQIKNGNSSGTYKVWTLDEYSSGYEFYVENFPIVNTTSSERDGYKAVDIDDLAEVINNS